MPLSPRQVMHNTVQICNHESESHQVKLGQPDVHRHSNGLLPFPNLYKPSIRTYGCSIYTSFKIEPAQPTVPASCYTLLFQCHLFQRRQTHVCTDHFYAHLLPIRLRTKDKTILAFTKKYLTTKVLFCSNCIKTSKGSPI